MKKADIEAIYDLLVKLCGAPEGFREDFIYSYSKERPPREWRFQGALGFGGKFWMNTGRWYVNCYREDETPERRTIIENANQALAGLILLDGSDQPKI